MIKRPTLWLLAGSLTAACVAAVLWQSKPSSAPERSGDSAPRVATPSTAAVENDRPATPRTAAVPPRHVDDRQSSAREPRQGEAGEAVAERAEEASSTAPITAPMKHQTARRDSQSGSASSRDASRDVVGRKPRRVATGLPGTGSRPVATRSYRGLAWTADSTGSQAGQDGDSQDAAPSENANDVNLVTDDSAGMEAPGENTVAGDEAGNGTPEAANDTQVADAGDMEPDPVEPEPIVTPLDVVQIARAWQEDVLQVSFALMLDDDPATTTPNGLIVSQQIPDGWQVVEADPLTEMVDEENRLVKWLFVGNAVTNSSIYSLSMRAPAEQVGNWNEALAWYTYRQPDGQCVDVEVIPYPESDIQPGN